MRLNKKLVFTVFSAVGSEYRTDLFSSRAASQDFKQRIPANTELSPTFFLRSERLDDRHKLWARNCCLLWFFRSHTRECTAVGYFVKFYVPLMSFTIF